MGAWDGTGRNGAKGDNDVIAGCMGRGAAAVAEWADVRGRFDNVAGWELDAVAARFFDVEFTGKGGMLRSRTSSKSSLLCCS